MLRDLIICHDSAFPVADTRHKQDDATVASHSPARQSAGICTATPPDELSPDNEVADTITPAARPPLPDTMYGLPMHPYVPIWVGGHSGLLRRYLRRIVLYVIGYIVHRRTPVNRSSWAGGST